MAWYRAGEGGIPSSIKTDMNAVLNKKFGTSQDYPPTDWAPSVNLLGPLPEKTVSGAVANITDGADGVPVKNWGVTVDATLSGVSSVVCTQAGKNFLDPSIVFENTTIYTYDSATGAVTVLKSDISAWNTKTGLPLKAGTYAVTNPTGRFQYRLASESYGTDHNITATTGTITLSADDDIKIKFGLGTTYPFTASYQLERNSTATTFEKYTAPTVSTVNLGRTIYGGSVDVVAGTGTDENGNDFTFTPISPTPETPLGASNFWADEGDSEVTYRADIDLLLGGN